MEKLPLIMIGFEDAVNTARKRMIRQKAHPSEIVILPPDSSPTLKIEHVRLLEQFTASHPAYGETKGIILTMDSATTESQNALLKLLEEPPSYVSIILLTSNVNLIIPTILSRAHIEKNSLKTTLVTNPGVSFSDVQKSSLPLRLEMAAKIGTERESAVAWISGSVQWLHQQFLTQDKNKQVQTAQTLRKLQRAGHTLSKTATNPRLLIENLFIELA